MALCGFSLDLGLYLYLPTMMKKFFLTLILLVPSLVLACPGCVGTGKGADQDKTVYILGVFILFTYVPIYYLFKMIIKYKDINGKRVA